MTGGRCRAPGSEPLESMHARPQIVSTSISFVARPPTWLYGTTPSPWLQAPMSFAVTRSECPLLKEDRKSSANDKTDAIDPGCVKNVHEQRMRRIVFSLFFF